MMRNPVSPLLDRLRRRRQRRRERGAAFVEYALFVGLLVLATTAGLTSLEDDADAYYNDVSDDIGDLPQAAIPVLTLPDGTPITTTTQAPTTTTSGATTTTAAPTTTTAPPPTTTTVPPTTTTAPPLEEATITELLDRSTAKANNKWRARVRITVRNSVTGTNVVGATVVGTFDGYNTKSCVTGNNGRCNISQNVSDNESSVLFTVDDIDANPDWDESSAAILLLNPE
ncbi:MAG: hypothetical protein AAGK32_07735 [Actinomycetota bacterium]